MKRLLLCASLLLVVAAHARLHAPVLTEEARAEAAARTAHSTRLTGYQLCRAQERVAAHYFREAAAAGRTVRPAQQTPPCVDPGPFVAAAPAAVRTP